MDILREFFSENREALLMVASGLALVFFWAAKRTANQTDDKIAAVILRWLRIK